MSVGTEWATVDTILPEKDTHIRGTKTGSDGKLTFWLAGPKPVEISVDEWEALQQEKWHRIFGIKGDE